MLACCAPAQAEEASCTHFEIAGQSVYYDIFLIFFDWDSTAIRGRNAAILDNVARIYAPLGHCDVVIAGHTDRSGSSAYNMALSRRRAENVGAYLRCRGIRSRFRFEPFGESRPAVENPDGAPDRQNRRAEIVVAPPISREQPGSPAPEQN